MRYLNKITDIAHQEFYLTGNPGQRIRMVMRYLPSQQMWMMDIEYLDFVMNGMIVACSPNILQGFHNIIPFGISCVSTDGLDPMYIDDFATQRCSLYLLTDDEKNAIEEGFFE